MSRGANRFQETADAWATAVAGALNKIAFSDNKEMNAKIVTLFTNDIRGVLNL